VTYDPLEDDEALARLEQAVLADADRERQEAEKARPGAADAGRATDQEKGS
jgi:hypothetical protein